MERTKPASRRKSEAIFGYFTEAEKAHAENYARRSEESLSQLVRRLVLAEVVPPVGGTEQRIADEGKSA